MKILKLEADNVKRLKAVEITPDPDSALVVIEGRNAQGKTSVLDSIAWALGGTRLVQEKPIREGETYAAVSLDLGEITVSREWTQNGRSTLKVEQNGRRCASPQSLLDDLLDGIAFDPLAFARMHRRDRVTTLLDVFAVDIDLDKIAAKRERLYENRTVIGREIKRLNGVLDSQNAFPPDLPDDEVCIDAIVDRYKSTVDLANRINNLNADRRDIRTTISRIESDLEETRQELAKCEKDLSEMPELPDIGAIENEMNNAEAINSLVREKQTVDRDEALLALDEKKQSKITKQIEKLDASKVDALQSAKIYPGLSIDENDVTYQGVPFDQSSSAEQLRVSLAIAMAANPKLRVIRITDGSLLDDENMKLIEEMASADDYQIWIERVGDGSGSMSIVIEDGSVKSKPKKRKTKPKTKRKSKADVEF